MKYEDHIKEREARSPALRAAYDEALEELAFARQLIRARAAAGLTQTELAERVSMKQPNIARLEGGTYQPSVATLQRLAEALNVRFEVTADSGLRILQPVGVRG